MFSHRYFPFLSKELCANFPTSNTTPSFSHAKSLHQISNSARILRTYQQLGTRHITPTAQLPQQIRRQRGTVQALARQPLPHRNLTFTRDDPDRDDGRPVVHERLDHAHGAPHEQGARALFALF